MRTLYRILVLHNDGVANSLIAIHGEYVGTREQNLQIEQHLAENHDWKNLHLLACVPLIPSGHGEKKSQD